MQTSKEVTYDPTNPYPWYRYMRDTHPVYHETQMNMWYIFRYEDVQQATYDYKTFSAEGSKGDSYLGSSFLSMDPPRHRQYRALVSQAFTPRGISQLEPRVVAIVDQLLDAVVAEKGKLDLIKNFSFPLPASVISELFGIPAADHDYFKQMSD